MWASDSVTIICAGGTALTTCDVLNSGIQSRMTETLRLQNLVESFLIITTGESGFSCTKWIVNTADLDSATGLVSIALPTSVQFTMVHSSPKLTGLIIKEDINGKSPCKDVLEK